MKNWRDEVIDFIYQENKELGIWTQNYFELIQRSKIGPKCLSFSCNVAHI